MRSPEASSFVLEAASAAAPGRREVKFSLPNVDAWKFRSILAVNCRRVSYAGATSRVCSIYFDDAALCALRANLDGTSRRTKTRIRWYDTPFPEKRFFFEVKRREDDGIFKERTPILASGSLASMSFHEIVVGLARVLPARLREHLIARSEPKLLIEYERTYYEAIDGPIRITLDRDLTFWGQGGLYPSRRFPARVPGLTIPRRESSVWSRRTHPGAPPPPRTLGYPVVEIRPGLPTPRAVAAVSAVMHRFPKFSNVSLEHASA